VINTPVAAKSRAAAWPICGHSGQSVGAQVTDRHPNIWHVFDCHFMDPFTTKQEETFWKMKNVLGGGSVSEGSWEDQKISGLEWGQKKWVVGEDKDWDAKVSWGPRHSLGRRGEYLGAAGEGLIAAPGEGDEAAYTA